MTTTGEKKRVLIFSTNYFPQVGGAELAVREITDRLEGFSFELIAPRLYRRLMAEEVVGRVLVHRVGFGVAFDKFLIPILGLMKAESLHKNNPFALSWSIMASQASVAASFFKKRHPETPLILTIQEGDTEEHLARYALGSLFLYRLLIRPWHLLVFRRADKVTAISRHLATRSERSGARLPVAIVPNGVSFASFSAAITPEERSTARKELGAQNGETILITVSRLVQKNAVGDCIEALTFLPKGTILAILGDGPDRHPLAKLADELGVEDRVVFLGEVSHDALPRYLAAADIFVRPSLSEGMGNAFIEAMAAGLPVIATPVGGIPDFLSDKRTGLFCGVHDPKDIALKVGVILRDRDLRDGIVAEARQMAKERYDWEKIAELMRKIFDEPANK